MHKLKTWWSCSHSAPFHFLFCLFSVETSPEGKWNSHRKGFRRFHPALGASVRKHGEAVPRTAGRTCRPSLCSCLWRRPRSRPAARGWKQKETPSKADTPTVLAASPISPEMKVSQLLMSLTPNDLLLVSWSPQALVSQRRGDKPLHSPTSAHSTEVATGDFQICEGKPSFCLPLAPVSLEAPLAAFIFSASRTRFTA